MASSIYLKITPSSWAFLFLYFITVLDTRGNGSFRERRVSYNTQLSLLVYYYPSLLNFMFLILIIIDLVILIYFYFSISIYLWILLLLPKSILSILALDFGYGTLFTLHTTAFVTLNSLYPHRFIPTYPHGFLLTLGWFVFQVYG